MMYRAFSLRMAAAAHPSDLFPVILLMAYASDTNLKRLIRNTPSCRARTWIRMAGKFVQYLLSDFCRLKI